MTERCGNCQVRIIDDGVLRFLVKPTGEQIRVCIECFRLFSVEVHSPPVTSVETRLLPYADNDVAHQD